MSRCRAVLGLSFIEKVIIVPSLVSMAAVFAMRSLFSVVTVAVGLLWGIAGAQAGQVEQTVYDAIHGLTADQSTLGLAATVRFALHSAVRALIDGERAASIGRVVAEYPAMAGNSGFAGLSVTPVAPADFETIVGSVQCPAGNRMCADDLRRRDAALVRLKTLQLCVPAAAKDLEDVRRKRGNSDDRARNLIAILEVVELERLEYLTAGLDGWVDSGAAFVASPQIREAVSAAQMRLYRQYAPRLATE
jgi:hypothetical protein